MGRDYDKMRALVMSAKGQFMSVTFRKVDGTMRTMNIQPAMAKFHVKGDAASDKGKKARETYKRNNPHLMPVWDTQKQAFRSINLDTVECIKVGGREYRYAA